MTARPELPHYHMPFEPMTIEHLGLRLYSTLPPVISELVSNAYDAESPDAEVVVPIGPITDLSEVVIRDHGTGMTPDELQDEYLPIGRNRRTSGRGERSKNNKVEVTGRKGLGKLSGFGVARQVEIRTVHDGFAVCLRLDYDAIAKWDKDHPNKDYEPQLVKERTGETKDQDGCEIVLRHLRRHRSIDKDTIRRGLARRLRFIGATFKVTVNGEEIKPGDRYQRSDCQSGYSWEASEIVGGGSVNGVRNVTGWLGFLEKSSQAGRGVDIFAKKKAVELESFFNYPSTHIQHARAFLVGEIHADFLDRGEDLVATARNSVVWESEEGALLQDWGQRALKWAFEKWLEGRRKEREHEIIVVGGFDKWLEERPESEKRVARRMVKLLVSDENIEASSMGKLLDIVKSSVETKAFHEMVEMIEDEGANPTTLLQLFRDWRVIEAREHLKLADGRLSALEKLADMMDRGALEVKQVQPLFVTNPWLLDPSWREINVQATYSRLLREQFPEAKVPPEDKRMDILGITESSVLTVVELKRPEKTCSYGDLEQIERYVDWAGANLTTGDKAPRYIRGLLLVGSVSRDKQIGDKMIRLAGDDIRVETYRDIYNRARSFYHEVDERLKQVAPEYARSRRKSRPKEQ